MVAYGDRLDQVAARDPGFRALTFLGDAATDTTTLSYGQLRSRARGVACALLDRVKPGDRVVILVEPGLGFFEAFLGCLYAGAVAVPLYPPDPGNLERTLARLHTVLADADPALVIVSPLTAPAISGAGGCPVLLHHAPLPDDGRALPAVAGDDLAFLQYTSGSTGTPKGVMVSHANLLDNCAQMLGNLGPERLANIMSWAPPYHDMGLVGTALVSWTFGGTTVQMSPRTFLAAPRRWLQALHDHRTTATFVPPFALDHALRHVPPAERAAFDLSALEVLAVGGEPVPPEALERFLDGFAASGFRATSLFPGYGLAEHTVWVTRTSGSGRARELDRAPLVGLPGKMRLTRYARPPANTAIVGEDGRPVPAGTIGELWLQSGSVAQGYWRKPELSTQVFRATAPGLDGAWLRTGDLGFLSDGELFITGRMKDVLIVRGKNHAPQDLEATAASAHPQLRPGTCVAFADRAGQGVVLVAEARPGADPDAIAAAVAARIARDHGLAPTAVEIVAPREVPRTANGKLARQLARQAWLDGKLGGAHVPAAPAPVAGDLAASIEATLCAAIARARGVEPAAIDPERPLAALGVDSLVVVQLAAQLRERFGLNPSPALLVEPISLRALARRLVAGEPAPPAAPTPVMRPLPVRPRAAGAGEVALSLMYFPTGNLPAAERYQLLLDSARFADERGFHALWIPERHFHAFGGSYPNPSVAAAALATITRRIRLRAGSVVLPLHDPLRVAEEWSLVDNLSHGRVDLAFATGWNANDFVLAPGDYAARRQLTLDGIETIGGLWSGGEITLPNGVGQPASVTIQPPPVQPRLDPWFTCAGGVESFLTAGGHGYHVLTGLLFQSLDELATKIALYRQARARHGHDPRAGKVTLMLHTFLGDDLAGVREATRVPLTQYLESSVDLWQQEAQRLSRLGPEQRAELLDFARERYLAQSALIGTPATAAALVARLAAIGVDELACLIDFGLDRQTVMTGLERLDELRQGLAKAG